MEGTVLTAGLLGIEKATWNEIVLEQSEISTFKLFAYLTFFITSQSLIRSS